ncbi:GDP-mannose 4,6-dehydratase [Helicobacter sp. NHP19-003]|uniref:GDP-mannose 4,6-dehydratase n=1 Tax=Helicobacter gastrocanis TaxID=2849641 RepID=A0ABM7SC07_9HELI|nr:GDP-mannose 4,6-dehydratase [Helicobacter sp. NHP19-003]BCZ18201.1 GDP-mannose 4,6-dehydratase [Helicobacter sp. NHP19-003]
MAKKIALITGITGQDGSYLARYLLDLGYEVHGIKRRSSSFNTARIDAIYEDIHAHKNRFFLHYGDLTDASNMTSLIAKIEPTEIYNLAAQSHVQVSFEMPEYTANVDALGTLRLLEAVRFLKLQDTRFYQASTSELYGEVLQTPQNENTPFNPRSPYAVAKLYAYYITKNYREAYNMFAVNGILFNHESPMRGETFVTRKITMALSRIVLGLQECLYLGNLDAKRDYGHAKDYVKAMHLILQHSHPVDYVVASGQTMTIRDFVLMACEKLGLVLEFQGQGTDEQGVLVDFAPSPLLGNLKLAPLKKGQVLVRVDTRYFRPTEVDLLLGDPSKIERELGWRREFSVQDLVLDMLKSDLELARKEALTK